MALRKKKTLLDQASEYVEAARPQVEAAVATALEAVEDFVENTARPALVDARDKAVPVVAAGAAKASQKAVEAATQAKEAADAKVAEVRGEEPKKGSKLKKLAIFAAVAGVVGFVASKLRQGKESDNWQSSYVPTPAPTTGSSPSNSTPSASTTAKKTAPAKKTADPGGAAPDEAIADAVEEPHEPTTPESPAEVVDVDAAEDAKQ